MNLKMDTSDFTEYLQIFETSVILKGFEEGAFGKQELVSVRNGKLAKTAFGAAVGMYLMTPEVVVIDYYGHFKKSMGFKGYVEKEFYGRQVRMVKVPVIHFASIKIEQVAIIGGDREITALFPDFKQKLLILRGLLK